MYDGRHAIDGETKAAYFASFVAYDICFVFRLSHKARATRLNAIGCATIQETEMLTLLLSAIRDTYRYGASEASKDSRSPRVC
jgi:hypothetical protein